MLISPPQVNSDCKTTTIICSFEFVNQFFIPNLVTYNNLNLHA